MFYALGKITVPSAGTPVSITQGAAAQVPRHSHSILIQVLPNNTGKIYIGLKGMNKTTFAGVLAVLAIPTTNIIQSFSGTISSAPNAFGPGSLYIDVDINGEGILASLVVT